MTLIYLLLTCTLQSPFFQALFGFDGIEAAHSAWCCGWVQDCRCRV